MMKKSTLIGLLALSFLTEIHAESATAFGQQAGVIAGTAEACGIDVSVFHKRIAEALPRMSQSATDFAYGMGTYQNSFQRAKAAQSAQRSVDCNQVAKDFRNLPIMRDDYQENVISKLATPTAMAPSAPNVPNGALPIQQSTSTANMPGANATVPVLPIQQPSMTSQITPLPLQQPTGPENSPGWGTPVPTLPIQVPPTNPSVPIPPNPNPPNVQSLPGVPNVAVMSHT